MSDYVDFAAQWARLTVFQLAPVCQVCETFSQKLDLGVINTDCDCLCGKGCFILGSDCSSWAHCYDISRQCLFLHADD